MTKKDRSDQPAIRARGLTKVYGEGESAVMALDRVDLKLGGGQLIAVIGASGSGKSTLLHVVSGLDSPTLGDSWVDGVHVQDLKGRKRARFRREKMGFVFQQHALIPVLTVRENVLLENSLCKTKPDPKEFKRVIGKLGLADRLDHLPDQLSGGQRQKTAIARVMMQRPSVLFADEPTGSLDVESSRTVMALLRELVDDMGMTVLMVTHSVEAAMTADRVIALRDGRLILDTTTPTVGDLEEAVSAGDSEKTHSSVRREPPSGEVLDGDSGRSIIFSDLDAGSDSSSTVAHSQDLDSGVDSDIVETVAVSETGGSVPGGRS